MKGHTTLSIVSVYIFVIFMMLDHSSHWLSKAICVIDEYLLPFGSCRLLTGVYIRTVIVD